jgi:hypothetical protein
MSLGGEVTMLGCNHPSQVICWVQAHGQDVGVNGLGGGSSTSQCTSNRLSPSFLHVLRVHIGPLSCEVLRREFVFAVPFTTNVFSNDGHVFCYV